MTECLHRLFPRTWLERLWRRIWAHCPLRHHLLLELHPLLLDLQRPHPLILSRVKHDPAGKMPDKAHYLPYRHQNPKTWTVYRPMPQWCPFSVPQLYFMILKRLLILRRFLYCQDLNWTLLKNKMMGTYYCRLHSVGVSSGVWMYLGGGELF